MQRFASLVLALAVGAMGCSETSGTGGSGGSGGTGGSAGTEGTATLGHCDALRLPLSDGWRIRALGGSAGLRNRHEQLRDDR